MKPLFLRPLLATVLATAALASVGAQALEVRPSVGFPIGTDAEYFTAVFGGEAAVSFDLGKPFGGRLTAGGLLGYNYLPVRHIERTCSILSGGPLLSFQLPLTSWLAMEARMSGGGYYGLVNGAEAAETTRGGSGWLGAEALVSARVGRFDFSAGGGCQTYLGMASLVSLKLGLGYAFTAETQQHSRPLPEATEKQPKAKAFLGARLGDGDLILLEAKLDPVFPVFFARYDDHPIGLVRLRNASNKTLEDISVSLFARQYMENPKAVPVSGSLAPGQEVEVPLYALFTNRVLEESEGTKLSATLAVEYRSKGETRRAELAQTLTLRDRNAISWDDDRKVAAFVTAKDQAILAFAKNSLAAAPENPALDRGLIAAAAIHEALRLYGLRYVVDPGSPYSERQAGGAIDFLQFPRQTLEFKAGDCDDLTTLYCALLEGLGVETAFITVPGHIFAAVALAVGPEEARRLYSRPDELVFAGGKAWVPVEVTLRGEGFLAAWQEGAKEWLEASSKGKAALYPTREAWAEYPPVAFPGSFAAQAPSSDRISAASAGEIRRFVERELKGRMAKAKLAEDSRDPRVLNRVGVLYAQYGLYQEAEGLFLRSLKLAEAAPVLVNLGNVASIRKDWAEALVFYERAEKLDPRNAGAVLAVARANHALENYGSAKTAYERLKRLDAQLAFRNAYLELRGEEAARAAGTASPAALAVWEE